MRKRVLKRQIEKLKEGNKILTESNLRYAKEKSMLEEDLVTQSTRVIGLMKELEESVKHGNEMTLKLTMLKGPLREAKEKSLVNMVQDSIKGILSKGGNQSPTEVAQAYKLFIEAQATAKTNGLLQ